MTQTRSSWKIKKESRKGSEMVTPLFEPDLQATVGFSTGDGHGLPRELPHGDLNLMQEDVMATGSLKA